MESAKKKFEAEREKILSELPQHIKDMFGTIGFAPAEIDNNDDDDDDENGGNNNRRQTPEADNAVVMIPVLILSPYDVPPKPVRDVYWFDLFSKCKRSKSLAQLAYLVYHYGADNPDDCYSFIEQEDFISYEHGCAAGYDQLPVELRDKIAHHVHLTEQEATRVRGIQELNEDAPKHASERKRGNEGFKERHEMLKEKLQQPPAKRQKK